MREALFILAVIAVILGYTAFRHRKTIAAVFQIFRMLRSPGEMQNRFGNSHGSPSGASGVKLVRCESCGVRIPEDRIIQANSGRSYCSRECGSITVSRK